MISYKTLDLLNVEIKNGDVYFEDELFIMKTPSIYLTDVSSLENNIINARLDTSINTHNRFKEILLYISRIYRSKNIEPRIIEENNIKILLDSESKFFDINHQIISKNFFNKEAKAICSVIIKKGQVYLHQCLKI